MDQPMRWLVLLLLLPSASAVELYLGYDGGGAPFFISDVREDDRETNTIAGRSQFAAPLFLTGAPEMILGPAVPSQGGSAMQEVTPLPLRFESDQEYCTPIEDSNMLVSLAVVAGGRIITGNPDHPFRDVYAMDVFWRLYSDGEEILEGQRLRVIGEQDDTFYLNWTVDAPVDGLISPSLEIVIQGYATSFFLGFNEQVGESMIIYNCAEKEPPAASPLVELAPEKIFPSAPPATTSNPQEGAESKETPFVGSPGVFFAIALGIWKKGKGK